MKKELKRAALFAAIGMSVFCFAGCGQNTKKDTVSQVSKEKPKKPENMSEAEQNSWDNSEALILLK